MLEQTLVQVRQVAVGISRRGDALVHLDHVHALPGHVLVRQRPQHQPRRAAAAHGHDEAPARRDRRPAPPSAMTAAAFVGHRIGIGQHFDLHMTPSPAHRSVGPCHLAGFSMMPAELEAHRREQLVLEIGLAARAEALVERGGEHSAGTPSSIAALIVQRPSPESETRPAKLREVRVARASAMAVRSSSHDATTLPRRQTSAMSARLRSYW